MILNLFKSKTEWRAAKGLYDQAVTTARQTKFYTEYGVPDTLDGRFESITLHVFALMFRLKNETGADRNRADKLAQYLFDAMFQDMERSLREMGVGDLGVPKKVKAMMRAFNGRCHAYTVDLRDGDLAGALRRNLYGTVPDVDADQVQKMTAYMTAQIKDLMATPYAELIRTEREKHGQAA